MHNNTLHKECTIQSHQKLAQLHLILHSVNRLLHKIHIRSTDGT